MVKLMVSMVPLIMSGLRPGVRASAMFVLLLFQVPALAQQNLLPAQPDNAQIELPSSGGEENSQGASPQRISQKQALEIARASYAGNIISISEVRLRNGNLRYRIRMDNEGNIFTVFVDARTGAVARE